MGPVVVEAPGELPTTWDHLHKTKKEKSHQHFTTAPEVYNPLSAVSALAPRDDDFGS